jgi:hypothetical protein
MEKRTIIIISLISAVFSLIYVLISYYGLIRYILLHIFPLQGYSENYKKLDKIGEYRNIISLTATPQQMGKMTHTIKSLLDQTVKVDIISLIVPQGNDYKLPEELKNYVSLFRCNQNQGLLNSLSTAIERESESTTRIITLGSDMIYGKDFIETILEESEQNPNDIIYVNNKKNYMDLTKGIVFSTKFFNENFLKYTKNENGNGNEWINEYFKDFKKKKVNYTENYKIL